MNPAAEIAQAAPQIDMSFWSLFWHAHIVVKLVMMGLIGASIWCWSIIVDKTLLYRRTRRDMDAFEEVFFLSQAVAPGMKQAGYGRIVNISSGAGLRPSLTGIQAYTSAKHALVGLTKQLALEFGPHGITVNSVAPGLVRSNPATERQWQAYGPEGQRQLLQGIHTRRLGTADDIAHASLFFLSEQAGWVTGQVLAVDGGRA